MPGTLPTLQLTSFGPPTARVDGAEPAPDVLWRKHLALLVYLALSPQRVRTRDHLLGVLWPEKTQDKARHSLNEAVRRLRAGLGSRRLVSEGEMLRLSDEALEVDALRFTELRERDPGAALSLLNGDFLEGFGLDDAPAFEDWAAAERLRFKAAGVGLLIKEGEAALGENRFHSAREAARRALALDSSAEVAASLMMRACALAGDATAALAAYHQFRDRLKEEMDEEPGQELQALAERIRTRRWRRASIQVEDLDPPLVGRADAHAAAFGLLDETLKGGGARCLVVSGDPGMGKTRLINECAERLALAGAVAVRARPLESDHDAQWSTLRLLARSGLTSMPGAAAADPRALAVLAGLVPELAERFEPQPARDAGDVAAALTSLLAAVAEEQPLGVLVDGAHLVDGSTVAALEGAARGLGNLPVAIVLAVDLSATPRRELLRLIGEVGRGIRGASLQLKPLRDDEMLELVTALAGWCDGPEQLERLARRITFEAGGNPLYAVTLLKGLDRTTTLKADLTSWPPPAETMDGVLPFTMPQLASMAVMARVAELEEESQAVLKAASLAGVALDLPLVGSLVGLPLERVEELIDQLEERRLVIYDGTRYSFAAALIPQVISSEGMTIGLRRRLTRKAIEELEGRGDLESRVLLAELRSKVDPDDGAFDDAVRIARAAHESGSQRTARRALAAAARMAAKGDPARQRVVDDLRVALLGEETQTEPGI